MAKFKIIVSDPRTGTSKIFEIEGPRAIPLVGRRLGETIDGSTIGLAGHKVRITGGSDRDGFPMRPDIHGGVKTRVILSEGVGFHPTRPGERRRRTIRGSVITDEIVQVNMKITEAPPKKPVKGAEKPVKGAEKPVKGAEKPEKTKRKEKQKKPKTAEKTKKGKKAKKKTVDAAESEKTPVEQTTSEKAAPQLEDEQEITESGGKDSGETA